MKYIRLYLTWIRETEQLTHEEKGRLIDALIEYATTGKENPPEGNERFVYPVLIERIRRENETHERHKAEKREARGA